MREPLLTRSFVVLSAAHFLYALSFYLYLHLPGLLVTFGASEIDIGVLSGVMSACAILSRPPVGRVMDIRGRRPILLFGGALGTVACAAYFAIDHWGPLLYAVRVAHGISNALMMPYVLEYNALADMNKFSKVAEAMGECIQGLCPREAAMKAVNAVRQLSIDVGIPQRMRDVGVPEEAIEGFVPGAMATARLMDNNPRKLTEKEVLEIYRKAW